MRHYILVASLLLLGSTSSRLHAQIKLPVFNEDDAKTLRKVRFEEAAGASDFQHGRLVRISLNGDESIQGILVRADRKNDRVYVRTEPGAAPRAFDVKQIKKIEKGVIREVGFSSEVVQPEIQQLVIYNGAKSTVSYTAPTLSTGEIERLRELELAENESSRMEYSSRLEDRVRENDIGLQTELLRTRALMNELLWKYVIPNAYAYRVPANGVYLESSQLVIGQPSLADPWLTYAALGASPTPIVRVGPTVPTAPSVDPASLVTARQRLRVAQGAGVYEQGRLVAIIVEEPAK